MTVNRDYIGRIFPPGEAYEVSRVKIVEFANAIGDPSALYRDRGAAQAAGHPDVIAPPTFATVFLTAGTEQMMRDPELGMNRAKIVHGEQRFEYTRPIVAGDVLTTTSAISDIREAGGNIFISFRTDITAASGERVCTAQSILVERG
jgi:acyl dehydratase